MKLSSGDISLSSRKKKIHLWTVKNPFPTSLVIANILNDLQDQFTSSLQNVGTNSKKS